MCSSTPLKLTQSKKLPRTFLVVLLSRVVLDGIDTQLCLLPLARSQEAEHSTNFPSSTKAENPTPDCAQHPTGNGFLTAGARVRKSRDVVRVG